MLSFRTVNSAHVATANDLYYNFLRKLDLIRKDASTDARIAQLESAEKSLSELKQFAKKHPDKEKQTYNIKHGAKELYDIVFADLVRQRKNELSRNIQESQQRLNPVDFRVANQLIQRINKIAPRGENHFLEAETTNAQIRFDMYIAICVSYKEAIRNADPYPAISLVHQRRVRSSLVTKEPFFPEKVVNFLEQTKPTVQQAVHESSSEQKARLDAILSERRSNLSDLHQNVGHIEAMQNAHILVEHYERAMQAVGTGDSAYVLHKINHLKASEQRLGIESSLADQLTKRIEKTKQNTRKHSETLKHQIAHWKSEGFGQEIALSQYLAIRENSFENHMDDRTWPNTAFA